MSEQSSLFGDLKKDIEKIEIANRDNPEPPEQDVETEPDSGIIEYYVPHVIYKSTAQDNPEDVKKTVKLLKLGRGERGDKRKAPKKQTWKKRGIQDLLFVGLACVAAGCIAFLLVSLGLDWKSEKAMKDLRAFVKAAKIQEEVLTVPEHDKTDSQTSQDAGASQITGDLTFQGNLDGARTLNKELLDVYGQLKNRNENFYGWLYVDGTEIDYPLMHGPDNDFYLSHDINKKYDKYGMLIMDYNCDDSLPVPHLIIYGHNVNSGKLFGELLNYKSEGYYQYHPVLSLDTDTLGYDYEIFAVFITTVDETQNEQELFTTWGYGDEESYMNMVNWAKSKSIYPCAGEPEFGEALLTLVTCEHSRDEGRLVVLASRK